MMSLKDLDYQGKYVEIVNDFSGLVLSEVPLSDVYYYTKALIRLRKTHLLVDYDSVAKILKKYSIKEIGKLYFLFRVLILNNKIDLTKKHIDLLRSSSGDELSNNQTIIKLIELQLCYYERQFSRVLSSKLRQGELDTILRQSDLYFDFKVMIAQSLRFTGASKHAIHHISELIETLGDTINAFDKTIVFNILGNIYITSGDWRKALKYQNLVLEFRKNLKLYNMMAINYSNIGVVYGELGNQELAYEYFKKAYQLDIEFGSKSDISISSNNVGNTARILGNLQDARNYLNHSLKLERELESPYGIAYALKNLARIDIIMGDLSAGQKRIEEAIEIESEISTPKDQSISYTLLARILYLQYQLEESKVLLKRSLEEVINNGTPNDISEPLMYLIRLGARHPDIIPSDEFQEYYQLISDLIPGDENLYVKQRQLLAEALYNRKLNRYDDALNLLLQIMNSSTVDHEINLFAAYARCEILMRYQEMDRETSIIITDILDYIQNIAEDQKSYKHIIHVHILKSRYAILQQNKEQSRIYLQSALEFAMSKGIPYLRRLVEKEIDNYIALRTQDPDGIEGIHDDISIIQYLNQILDESLLHLVETEEYHITDIDGVLCGISIENKYPYLKCPDCRQIKMEELINNMIKAHLFNWQCFSCYQGLSAGTVNNLLSDHKINTSTLDSLTILGIQCKMLNGQIYWDCENGCQSDETIFLDISEIKELFE